MADFVPAPGTRVTVGGVTWEWREGVFTGWYSEQRPSVFAHNQPPLTRIAEFEAEATHLRARAAAAEAEVQRYREALCDVSRVYMHPEGDSSYLIAPAKLGAVMDKLARYAAIGEEAQDAWEDRDTYKHDEIVGRLAAEYRAQEEGR